MANKKNKNFYSLPNNWQERMRIDSSGNLGIGVYPPAKENESPQIINFNQWMEIIDMCQTNPAMKTAYEKLITIYHLSKDNEQT